MKAKVLWAKLVADPTMARLGFDGDAALGTNWVMLYSPIDSMTKVVARIESRNRSFFLEMGTWFDDEGAPIFFTGVGEHKSLSSVVKTIDNLYIYVANGTAGDDV